MPKIIIKNMSSLTLSTACNQDTVLHILQQNFIDWMHACGGKGRCTTCKFHVVDGVKHLDEPTTAEKKYFNLGQLIKGERLSCQARLLKGELEIEVPQEYKLPHVKYSY